MRGDVRSEWDGTKQHDVLFLLTIDPPDAHQLLEAQKDAEAVRGEGGNPSPDKLYGLVSVRGCEVIEVGALVCLLDMESLFWECGTSLAEVEEHCALTAPTFLNFK